MNKYLEYTIIALKIKLKTLNEYKINLYFGIIVDSIWILIQIFMLFIMNSYFNDLINWSFKEYLFFIILFNFTYRFFAAFFQGTRLRMQLLKGNMNTKITKPVNVFWQYMISTFIVQLSIISFFFLMVLILYIIVYYDTIIISKLIVLIPFCVMGGIFNLLIVRLFDSFAFFMKSNSFLYLTYRRISQIFVYYPATMFEGTLKNLTYFISMVFYGTYATEFLFGHINYKLFFIMLSYLIFINIILIIGIYLSWHYGLKKYEAYG